MNIVELKKLKSEGRKLSMVTCYDAWSAKILNESPIDMLLVGDSSAMVMHGFDDTIPSTIEAIAVHTAAVRRGAPLLALHYLASTRFTPEIFSLNHFFEFD